MIIERDRGTKGWENPCQLRFSRDKPMVCDQFWKIFTALLISYSFLLIAIRVYFHMKQQSCSCSAHLLPSLLPLWTWPWVYLQCWGFYFMPNAGHTEPQQHPQSIFLIQICLLEMNHLLGSKQLIAHSSMSCYWGGQGESVWGRLAGNHHTMVLDAFKKNQQLLQKPQHICF